MDGTTAHWVFHFFRQEDEVTKRFSQKLLNPFGPKLVKTRFFLQIFPVHRLLGGSTTGSIASMASMVLH